jgi:hypothetical protein
MRGNWREIPAKAAFPAIPHKLFTIGSSAKFAAGSQKSDQDFPKKTADLASDFNLF